MDIHFRATDNFVGQASQFIVRPALIYFISNNLRINGGYAYILNFPPEGLSTVRPEHRPWQQIWWRQVYPGFQTLQWLRFEQRFVGGIENDQLTGDYTFNYRLRYNISFFIPLKGKEIVASTPFLAVIDEVFFNFGERIVYNTFDQNRFFIGLGYQINPAVNLQFGYMHLFQQAPSGNQYNSTHAIRLFAFQNLDFRKKD